MKELNNHNDEQLEYKKPELKEHGSVEEVTLQTFFGTFSPQPPMKNG